LNLPRSQKNARTAIVIGIAAKAKYQNAVFSVVNPASTFVRTASTSVSPVAGAAIALVTIMSKNTDTIALIAVAFLANFLVIFATHFMV
jgi:hypothetical protein